MTTKETPPAASELHLRDHWDSGAIRDLIELDIPSFLRTAGTKRIRSFRETTGRKPAGTDYTSGTFWQFSF